MTGCYSLNLKGKPYLVLPFDDAHLDVIFGRVPHEAALLCQVCQTEVVHHVSGTRKIIIKIIYTCTVYKGASVTYIDRDKSGLIAKPKRLNTCLM